MLSVHPEWRNAPSYPVHLSRDSFQRSNYLFLYRLLKSARALSGLFNTHVIRSPWRAQSSFLSSKPVLRRLLEIKLSVLRGIVQNTDKESMRVTGENLITMFSFHPEGQQVPYYPVNLS